MSGASCSCMMSVQMLSLPPPAQRQQMSMSLIAVSSPWLSCHLCVACTPYLAPMLTAEAAALAICAVTGVMVPKPHYKFRDEEDGCIPEPERHGQSRGILCWSKRGYEGSSPVGKAQRAAPVAGGAGANVDVAIAAAAAAPSASKQPMK